MGSVGTTMASSDNKTQYMDPEAPKPLAELARAALILGRPVRFSPELNDAFHNQFAADISPVIERIRREQRFC